MKKIFTLILLAGTLIGFAQNNVTFKVDMNQYSGSTAAGVFVNGNFTTNGAEWCGTCNPMTDANADGIWEVTLPIASDTMEYKFTIDGWNDQEIFAGGEACTKSTGGFTNRYLTRSGAVTLDVVCFNACMACSAASADSVDITFKVNTASLESVHPSGIFIAGGNDFGIPGDNPLTDANMDGVWEITIRKPKGIKGNYIFLNGSASSWDAKEQLAGKPCSDAANYNDRILPTITSDTTIQACYGECSTDGSCPTIIVDAEPMTAAADPTANQEDVISLFSGVYTDVMVNTWRTDWSNATLEDVQVAGNDVKKYSKLDFVGIEATGDNSIDASTMTDITFDAWTPNATTYRIKLVDFGADNSFGGGDDSEHEVVFETPATETWTNHKIALADMANLAATSNISQIIFSALPTAGSTLYLDNIYFSKEAEVNSVSEATFNTFNVYPNPTKNIITVNAVAKSGIINSYTIQGVNGQVISETSVNSPVLYEQINISDLEAGIYFIKVSAEQGSYTHKVVVQ